MTDVEVAFSGPGDLPTRFEVELLAANDGDGHWEMVAQALVRNLGPEIAARALVTVFDEIGGEKVHTPRRDRFFSGMWSKGREDWAVARVTVDRWTLDEVAAVLRVRKERVSQIVCGAQRTKINPGSR